MAFDDDFLPWQNREEIDLPDKGDWAYLLDRLEEAYPHSVFSLSLSMDGSSLVANGALASVGARDLLLAMLKDHPLVDRIDSRIEVTAPFTPAAAGDDPFAHLEADFPTDLPHRTPGDSGEAVVRYPSIRPLNEARPDEQLTIEVTLAIEPDELTQGGPATIQDVPDDWATLEVVVHLDSPHLTFPANGNTGTVTLRNGKSSLGAIFSAVVNADAASHQYLQLEASFYYKDRKCGGASRLVPLTGEQQAVVPDTAPVGVEGEVDSMPGASPNLRIDFEAEPPELTISIHKTPVEGTYFWTWRSRNSRGLGQMRNSGTVELGTDTGTYAKSLLTRCANLRPGNHAMTLEGIGTEIWEKTPQDFRALYLALRDRVGTKFPIQIFSDEPHVPWEMMLPVAGADDDQGDHLFMSHPIARWFIALENAMPASYSDGGITSFVPKYKADELPGATAEGAWLVKEYGAIEGDASHNGFTTFFCDPLPDKNVGVVHFAGHGDGTHGQSRGLRMTDDWVPVEALKNPRIKLGRRDKALVIINACEVGATDFKLGVADGWPFAMAKAGFGGILAPLWAVQDEHASSVVKGAMVPFMGRALKLADAVTAARNGNRGLSAAPYAYLLYGDVMAPR